MKDIITFFETFGDKLGSTKLRLDVFFTIFLILMFSFVIKFCVEVSIERKKTSIRRKLKYYITRQGKHCALCFIFSVVSASLIIIVTGCKDDNIVLNYFLSPMFSFLASFWFDGEILKKYDAAPSPVAASKQESPLTEEELDDKGICSVVNELYSNQQKLSEEMDKQSSILESLDLMVKAIITDSKEKEHEWLEENINNCLNKGYATIAENKSITMHYNSYRRFGGNGEIEALYENHYLRLKVHN